MTIVSREETQLDWLGVESLSLESLSVESLCVLGGEMASRRRCSAFTCDTCSAGGRQRCAGERYGHCSRRFYLSHRTPNRLP